ncbi:MAG: ABC transporter ATP-binding protein [Clostridia bacterium]|nr:ABC transporter ATP-binding protein [Clostridia bacterium]
MKQDKTPRQRARRGTLKKIFSYVGKYPIALSLCLLLYAATVAFTLYIPILVGDGIDLIAGAGKVDFKGLREICVKIGISLIGAALSQWLVSVINNRITYSVVERVRADAFEKIGALPLKYLDSHPHGDVVSRVIADTEQFADGILIGFMQFFISILTIGGTLIFMFLTNVKIALVVVLLTPLSLFVARFISSKTYGFFKKQTEVRGEQTAFTEEMISNLKTVQAFSREDENEAKFAEIEGWLKKASLDSVFFSSLTNPTTRFVNNIVYALVALIGALEIGGMSVLTATAFTVGGLTKFLAYANQYTKPFNDISGVITELQSAFVCASRVFELLEEEEQPSDEGNRTLSSVDGDVSFDSVSFSYTPEQRLIEDFSLTVCPGQRVAIVGPTGSGKTTLINLLMRFYDVTGGAVKIEGEDVRALTRNSLRSSFGMVLQETWLKSGTVRENILLGRENATEEELITAAKAAHAHGFIKRLPQGYDTPLGEEGGLSQGQKQLLCIARIMLALPPMLILDEATSSIDTRTELKISDAFQTLMEGRTSFVVAHRLSTIRHADVILVLNDGKIVESGTHETLLARGGFYHNLYNSQFG